MALSCLLYEVRVVKGAISGTVSPWDSTLVTDASLRGGLPCATTRSFDGQFFLGKLSREIFVNTNFVPAENLANFPRKPNFAGTIGGKIFVNPKFVTANFSGWWEG